MTGTPVWSINTGCEGGGGNTPVVASGRVYAAISSFYSGNVYDSESGTVLGAFNYSVPPAVSNTHAFASTTPLCRESLQDAPHFKRTGGSLNDRPAHQRQKRYVRSAPTVRGSMTEIR